MRTLAFLAMATVLMLTACARQDRGLVEVDPAAERQGAGRMEQPRADERTSLRDVEEKMHEAWQTTQDYAQEVTIGSRDDVEDKLNETSDNLRELREEAQTSETVRGLERELQGIRRDFNRLDRRTRQSAGEALSALQKEWQDLEDRLDELSVEVRTELKTRETTRPEASRQNNQ